MDHTPIAFATLGELIGQDSVFPGSGYQLYTVFDGRGTILYVGKTSRAIGDRLRQHIGIVWPWKVSLIGSEINDHAPRSDNWIVELRTAKSCADIVAAYSSPYAVRDRFNLDDAERALIAHYAPMLNITHNC